MRMNKLDELNMYINRVMVGGNHLASALINNNIYPNHVGDASEIKDIELRDMFFAWKAIMDLRDFLDDTNQKAGN